MKESLAAEEAGNSRHSADSLYGNHRTDRLDCFWSSTRSRSYFRSRCLSRKCCYWSLDHETTDLLLLRGQAAVLRYWLVESLSECGYQARLVIEVEMAMAAWHSLQHRWFGLEEIDLWSHRIPQSSTCPVAMNLTQLSSEVSTPSEPLSLLSILLDNQTNETEISDGAGLVDCFDNDF